MESASFKSFSERTHGSSASTSLMFIAFDSSRAAALDVVIGEDAGGAKESPAGRFRLLLEATIFGNRFGDNTEHRNLGNAFVGTLLCRSVTAIGECGEWNTAELTT